MLFISTIFLKVFYVEYVFYVFYDGYYINIRIDIDQRNIIVNENVSFENVLLDTFFVKTKPITVSMTYELLSHTVSLDMLTKTGNSDNLILILWLKNSFLHTGRNENSKI